MWTLRQDNKGDMACTPQKYVLSLNLTKDPYKEINVQHASGLQTVHKGSYFVLLSRLKLVPGLGVVLAIPSEDKQRRKVF